jgi:hypothetical protein
MSSAGEGMRKYCRASSPMSANNRVLMEFSTLSRPKDDESFDEHPPSQESISVLKRRPDYKYLFTHVEPDKSP